MSTKKKSTKKAGSAAAKKGKPVTDKEVDEIKQKVQQVPRGCRLEDVERDIRLYGCFEFANCVYMVRSGKTYEAVSNFTCSIRFHIKDRENPMKFLVIANEAGEVVPYEVPGTELLSLMGFRKWTEGKWGNFRWTGNEADYQRYSSMMNDKMGSGRMIVRPGWQPEGFFAMRNAALNGSIIPLDEYGCFEVKGRNYYNPAGNETYADNPELYENAKRLELVTNELTFKAWNAQLRKVHREHSITATLWTLAGIFSDVIFQRLEGFPLLFFYGEASSGKNQLATACMALTGRPLPQILLSGSSTEKGKLRFLSENVNVPLLLDEYEYKSQCDEALKGIYDRSGYMIGNTLSKYSNESIRPACPVFVCGNEYPNRLEALMSRMIVEEFHQNTFTDEERKEYDKLDRMKNRGCSGLLPAIIAERERFERTWYDSYYIPAQELLDETFQGVNVEGRLKKNVAILLTMDLFFRERLEFAFTREEFLQHIRAVIVQQLGHKTSGNEVAHWWTCFVASVRKGRLKEGENFAIQGDRLRLYWMDGYTAYLETYRELFQERGVRETTLKGKLKHHRSWIGPLKSCKIGERNTSAYEFDLQEAGTNVLGLIRKLEPMEAKKLDQEQEHREELEPLPF